MEYNLGSNLWLARSNKPSILIVCFFVCFCSFVLAVYLLFCAKEMKAKFAEFRPLFSRKFHDKFGTSSLKHRGISVESNKISLPFLLNFRSTGAKFCQKGSEDAYGQIVRRPFIQIVTFALIAWGKYFGERPLNMSELKIGRNHEKRDFRRKINNTAVEKEPEKIQDWPGNEPLPLRYKIYHVGG